MGSRIEAGITIEGSVRGEGELTVGGRVRGVLHLQGTLVIEEGGAVEAEVEASSVVVAGLLAGSVTAHEELRVLPGGCVDARVRAARLAMADGAIFRGEMQAPLSAPSQLAAPTTPRLAAPRTAVAQLAVPAAAPSAQSDAIPPIPTLHKPPHAHMQVAAPPPPVGGITRHQTITPPPPNAPVAMPAAAPSSPPLAPNPTALELEPVPTTPAPPMKPAGRGDIPPAPRLPDLRDTAPKPTPKPAPKPAPKARAFTAPPPRAREKDAAPRDDDKREQPRADAPRDRNATPRMPALPRGRGSMSRRGGGA